MRRMRFPLLLVAVLALVASACTGDDDASTPETVVVTSIVEVETPGETVTSVVTETVTAEAIQFWSTETQPERLEITKGIIEGFTAETGIQVTLVPVDENGLPESMVSAAATGLLPEVIFHPVDFTVGWANQGLLDTQAADDVITALGVDTFQPGALELASVDGSPAAVPSDGWGQLLLYRKDLFDAAGLGAPDTFANIQAGAEALHDPGNGFFGITAATAGGEVFTQQTVEQFMLANGCELTDGSAATLDTPQCVEALEFYTNLVGNFGTGAGQDVVTTRATYFAGDAAMIIWSPFILDEMAGLRDSAFPACEECADNSAFLAEASGIIPSFSGPSGSASQYGQVSNLGIGANSNTEAAKMFVEYFLSTGYLDWLSTSPEGKLPMRLGNADNPTEYIDGWKELETGVDRRAKLSDFYSVEVIDTLVQGADSFSRWGFAQNQGELVTAIYSSLPVPGAVGAILDGASVAGAAEEMQSIAQEEFELING